MKQKTNDNFNRLEIDDKYSIVYGFNFKVATIWYDIANENLITSKVLINSNRYAHATFFMQQCIESFTKGFLIHCEVVSPEKVKIVSHNIEDTICELYKKVGSEYDLKVIQNIRKKLMKYECFSDKLANVIIPCANNLIEQFEKTIKDSTFGIITIQGYITNMLILLSLLLDQSTQQNTRYYDNDSYPWQKYTSHSKLEKVLEYLDSINKWIEFLANKQQ